MGSRYEPDVSTRSLLRACAENPDLAAFAGVYRPYVQDWIEYKEAHAAPSLKYHSQEIQAKAIAMAGHGLSAARVAKSLGIATSTVGYWWRRANGVA